ncbi:MAG: hypothetical protein KDE27_19480, partial [Planctomycetes bacterium]|nr:hypothetical protein [Planctomycetota bacterium]
MTASDVPLGDLLLHAEFVRGLARDLAADEAAADDLTQESWLRALQRPPRHDAALRGWFATLVANVWRNGRRAAERRRRRERLAGA